MDIAGKLQIFPPMSSVCLRKFGCFKTDRKLKDYTK